MAKCPYFHAAVQGAVLLRVDSDVLEWFKAQGKGRLTRMNAVLRSYVAAHKNGPRR
ncbi:MAG: BrnA antitoxin family protein [Methylocella sp.]